MTDKEFERLALAIKAAYPNANMLPDAYAMKFWFQMLGDLDYHDASNALVEHVNTSTFAPSIAEIRQRCTRHKISIPEWGDAWERALRAVRRYGVHREAEALESLDETTREALKRFDYKSLCLSNESNVETNRAQFREIYSAIARRRKEDAQLPPSVLEERERLKLKHMGPERPRPSALIDSTKERAVLKEMREGRAEAEYVRVLIERIRAERPQEGGQ